MEQTVDTGGGESHRRPGHAAVERWLGIDIGAETIKVVELVREGEALRLSRRRLAEHGKDPGPLLRSILSDLDWGSVRGAAVSGRLSRLVNLPRVPAKEAQVRGYRFLSGVEPATLVSIGSHGFSVLELRAKGIEVFRENSRCSQGTGNFLRQLVERFSLTIEEASDLCAGVRESAPLSGRCPVILKTDMTHLANKGEDRSRILAGLFDAVCENVLVLIKPGVSPRRVVLIGGVGRSPRVRSTFRESLERMGMDLALLPDEEGLFLEALGSAAVASERPEGVPPLEGLLLPPQETRLERSPALSESLGLVRRMERRPPSPLNGAPVEAVLGFDIGSTGSKVVAMNASSREVLWEGYLQTSGDPVGAAQALLSRFLESPAGRCPVLALGVTGSGREIVGSLMASCYGRDSVFILNEIAAHAEGALHHDRRVDTIFEIGGQDAKYIRLADGRVVDCAMNEACSAGTGSFIEEQGRKFSGIRDVLQLGREALSSSSCVSLGQHCSVFMAEIIDEAVAAGVDQRSIVAGLYDSIIQNYLHRVKGSRSVGEVIFCQGMPFSSDALAAAVARQTGSRVVIPPNPGTVGALGIALLAAREIPPGGREPIRTDLFLGARLEKKDTFVCRSTTGCGGSGTKCRIDRIQTVVGGERQRFSWGGGCALHDKGTRKKKLPDRASDPFREREEALREAIAPFASGRGRPTVALTDEFALKGLFPFFAAFLHELGFDLSIPAGADQATLKRGIQEANVPFCAPMQLYHGQVSRMAEEGADHLFLPMIRGVPRVKDERSTVTCPIVQASADLIRWDLRGRIRGKVVSPVIDIGQGNLESREFLESLRRLAAELGVGGERWLRAHATAREVQARAEERFLEIGRRALGFCSERGIVPVVVLGRPYTIYSKVLNSNVPAILREQGAVAIPLDCYPVDGEVPVFEDMYWGYGQRILRAAHQIRRSPGVFSLYASNYSCGPDSFNLHFYSYIMEGKPFAIIETDGHSGDAGTKTRVEAFLHCVEQDLERPSRRGRSRDFRDLRVGEMRLPWVRERGSRVLIPSLGAGSKVVSACLNGIGIPAEDLPIDRESVRIGRRHTSGKECLPMCITLGSLLQRLEGEEGNGGHFTFLMPRTQGPCRFGIYNILNRITLDRLSWKDRFDVWSPSESGYFEGTPPAFAMQVFTGFVASDLLLGALHHVRPVEARPGAAREIHDRCLAELLDLLRREAGRELSLPAGLWEVASGRLFGVRDLLGRAAAEFAAVGTPAEKPTVLLVGEIYVRLNPFSNDFIVEKLERRGLRVRLAPFQEFLEYTEHTNFRERGQRGISGRLNRLVQEKIQGTAHAVLARELGWPQRTRVEETLAAAGPYIRKDLMGEAVLTVGLPVEEWRAGRIDAVVSVGPLECMPNKISEAQFFHIAEREGLLSLTLSLNGDPVDDEVLDSFAFEVHARHRKKLEAAAGAWTCPRCSEDRGRRKGRGIRVGRLRRRPAPQPEACPHVR